MASTSAHASNESVQPSTSGRRLRGRALAALLVALMLTLLLEALDQTVVGTALPKIVGQLQGFDRYTWVATAYLLASTTMIPIVGKLSDQFGRKWFFVAGVAIFLVGSTLCGAAQTINDLIAFRAAQGLGAGVGIALVFTVVGDIFPPAERARWQGVFSGVYGFSSVVGPTIGGWLTDHGPLVGSFITNDTRWRWVFYVNLPIGFVALAVLLLYLPANISTRTSRLRGWTAVRRIDFAGAFAASAATILLLLGLTWGGDQTYAWNSPQVVAALVAAGVLFVAFVVIERFAAEPILPLDLFRNQVFAADSALSLLLGAILFSLVIYLPLYLQGVLGESATNSGAVITPLTVSLVIGAALSGFAVARFGRYQLLTILGAALLSLGVFLMARMTASTSVLEAGRDMVIAGVGLGMFFSILVLAVQNAIPRSRLGVGTAATRYLQAAGQTIGLAITGTVVNNTVATELAKRLPPNAARTLTPQGLAAATNEQALISAEYRDQVIRRGIQAATSHASPQAAQQIAAAVTSLLNQVFAALKQAEAVGIQHGFVVALVFCGLLFVGTLFLKDVPLRKSFEPEGAAGEQQGHQEAEFAAPGV